MWWLCARAVYSRSGRGTAGARGGLSGSLIPDSHKQRPATGRALATNGQQPEPALDQLREKHMTLEAAWASKRNRTTCGRGHPIPAYTAPGTIRRCKVCETMRRAIRAERYKYGPPRIKVPRPVASNPRTHCPSGHPYSGANLRISYRGENICRTCANAASERWKREKKLDGKNPYRWKPKEETIRKIENAAAEGMLICQAKGRIRGAKPIDLAAGGQAHLALIGRTFLRNFTMVYEGRTGTVTIHND